MTDADPTPNTDETEYGQSGETDSWSPFGIQFPNDAVMLLAVLVGIYSLYVVVGLVLGYDIRGMTNQLARLTFWIAVFGMSALALNLHWGYTGLFNIGIVGFMATGIYVTAMISKPVFGSTTSAAEVGGFGLPLWLGIIGGVVAAGLLGLIAALPALRLRADYLAIVTVALSEIVRFALLSDSLSEGTVAGYTIGLGGGDGIILDFGDPLERFVKALGWPIDLVFGTNQFLWEDVYLGVVVEAVGTVITTNPKPVVDNFAYAGILLVIMGGFYVLLRRIGNSPFGRVLKGIREDEDVTNALGKNTNRFKITSFVVGCALMGLVGILWYGTQGSVAPNTFRPRITFYIWIALIIGGAGSNTGSVVGGAIFAAFLYQGPLYFKNVVETVLGNPSSPSTFGHALANLSNGDVVPLLLYTLDSLNQLQLVIMGLVLIWLMHNRPDGMLGHRKEIAASIPLTRSRRGNDGPVATDGGERDE